MDATSTNLQPDRNWFGEPTDIIVISETLTSGVHDMDIYRLISQIWLIVMIIETHVIGQYPSSFSHLEVANNRARYETCPWFNNSSP